MPIYYPWERRWLEMTANRAVDEAFHQVESDGYVAASVLTWKANWETRPIGISLEDGIAERQVVILLGEPGSGKSSEWRKLRGTLEADAQHLFLNLDAFSAEDELKEALLDDPKTVAWQPANYILTLWLDSLDEGLLHMRKLQDTLLRLLRKLPLERLRLRLTCRNAVWPAAFTDLLGNLWQFGPQPTSEQISVLLLRPLTRQQVAEAAQAEGLPPEDFLTAVAELDAQPLASLPVTMRLLLSLYKKHRPGFGVSETAGRAGLYELGCLELCDAPDEERDEQHRVDGRQRLLLAGYLAYLAVFSNRRQIHLEPVRGGLGENALDPYAAGAGQTVPWQQVRVSISPATIRDLLKNTSLFTDLGNGCLVWGHQAFAEFLAAWYLNLTGISVGNLRALFRSAADPAGGIVPALRETAAWLAELRPDFWQELLQLDPLALVRGDLRLLRNEQRAAVVRQLAAVIGTLAYPPYLESREQSFLQQLRHPGLAAQLTPLLALDDVPPAAARFAMDLAKACNVQELVPELTRQALDATQPFQKRARALNILRDVMPDEAKPMLRPLIHGVPDEDERDEFRADLLRILWPAHLTPGELLPLLTPERDNHFIGAYHSFIHELEREDITFSADSVRASLAWLARQGESLEQDYRHTDFWRRFMALIWRQAWHLVAEPGMKEAVAAAYAASVAHYEYFEVKGATDAARVSVLEVLLARGYYKKVEWVNVVFAFSRQEALVGQADWDILFPLLYKGLTAGQREWLAKVLRRLLLDSSYLEPVSTYCRRYEQYLTASRKYKSVRAAWHEWFSPSIIDSEDALKAKQNWQSTQHNIRQQSWKKVNRRRITLQRVGRWARFTRWLVQREVVHYSRHWGRLLEKLRFDKTGKNSSRQQEDPGQSKRWRRMSLRMQAQVLDRLWEFVEQHPVPPPAWYEVRNRTTYGAEVLREGLALLLSQRGALVRSQPPVFWQNLAPFLIRFDESAHEGPHVELLRLAATYAPHAVDSALSLSMNARDSREHDTFRRFKDWYGWLPAARFPGLILVGVEFGVWNEELAAEVLTAMLAVNYVPAWEYVRELLSVPTGCVIERPKLAIAVFGWLLFRKTDFRPGVWQYWEWLICHLDIARAVITNAINHPSPRELTCLAALAEEELVALVRWLTDAFDLLPADVDDWQDMNPRGKYASLRTAAVAELAGRGTMTAWQTLEQLHNELGQPYWMKGRLDQVRENLRRNAWEPASPEELIELSQQTGRRVIKSAADLQELVLDSLGRFQVDLHNELAWANTLWVPKMKGNKQVGHKVRDENYLSDVLRLYLHKDLNRSEVLIKREVEIRKSIGTGTGQRTDLYIEAFTRDEKGGKTAVVTVVIEVKLAKHRETETALAGQLLPYLADQTYKHGIYLVGWHYGEYDPLPTGKKDLAALHSLLQHQTGSVPGAYAVRTLILDIRLAADKTRGAGTAALFEVI